MSDSAATTFASDGHGVFVNYRVGDQETNAALIAEVLVERFGRRRVFLASRSLAPGTDFADGLSGAAGRCSVFLAVIGPQWFQVRDDDRNRRLDAPHDWVRREIEQALAAGSTVIPVLVGDQRQVPVLTGDMLPPSIAPMSGKHYIRLNYRALDLGSLVTAVLDADPDLALGDLWALPSPPPPVWTPANLLRADYEVVSFTGRARELDAIRRWRDHPARLAARVITGIGGQGKSRLGRQAAEEARAAKWSAGTVAESLPRTVLDRLRRTESPLFLVVDYAEGRLDSLLDLTTVLADRDAPARLLLLSRSAGEWRDRLTEHGDDRVSGVFAMMTEQPLEPLNHTAADRRAEFRRAADAFAYRLGHPVQKVPIPPRVDSTDGGSTETAEHSALDLHATALAGLLDVVDGHQPATSAAPLARVLDHERRYWRRTLAVAGLDTHDERPGALLAAATLFTAETLDSATELARSLVAFVDEPQRLVRRYVAWAAQLYPGPDHLNPMLPDRLGEEHVAAVLREQPDVLTAPMARAGGPQADRGLLVVGRAASRHPHVKAVLRHALDIDPERLLLAALRVAPLLDEPMAFSTVIKEALDDHRDGTLVERVLAALPSGSVALADVAVLASEVTLANADAHARSNPVRTAHLLRLHSIHLTAVGRRAEALSAARTAVRLLEEHGSPAAVASALVSLADRLHADGDRNESGPMVERAVAILRGLPEDHRSELASALYSQADQAYEAGAFQEALECAKEAVTLYRALDVEEPGAATASHASCLLLLATCMAALGELAGQRRSVTEAVRLYRTLAEKSPDSHLSSFAAALSHDARVKLDMGDVLGALTASREGLAVRRKLADRYPEVYRQSLAQSLTTHAQVLQRMGRDAEAGELMLEAVDVLADLSPGDPNWPILLGTKVSQVSLLVELNRADETVDLAEAVVAQWRDLVTADRDAHLPELARALLVRSSVWLAVGTHDRAVWDATEAAEIYRELAARLPGSYQHFVARALNAVAVASRARGRTEDALAAVREAISARSALAASDPDAHRRELASAYANLGTILDEYGESDQGIAATGEALRMLNAPTLRSPADKQRAATTSSALGVRLAEHGRAEEGHRLGSLAVAMLRPLVDAGVGPAVADLALALNNLGMTASAVGDPEAGLAATQESVALRTGLAAAQRHLHLPGLANAVYNLSIRLGDLERYVEAESAAGKAVLLYRELAEDGRVRATSLALALFNHVSHLADAGKDPMAPATEALEIYEEADGGTGQFTRQITALRGIVD